MTRTRIKFCGLTRQADAEAAAEAGADALGMVFYAGSKRAVSASDAAAICHGIPPFVALVGLFVNADADDVRRVCDQVPLSLLQFHGDEDAVYCEQFGMPYIKAVRVRDTSVVPAAFRDFPSARGILTDAYDAAQYGGTGQSFNWGSLPAERPSPLILAGGLSSANVASAVRQVRPWAVDVSGGIEDAPGIKSIEHMRKFVSEVRSVD